MLKIIGEVKGVLTDIETGEQTFAFDETNHVQDWLVKRFIKDFINGGYNHEYIRSNLWVSSNNPEAQRTDTRYIESGGYRVGSNITGVTSPIYTFFKLPEAVHLKEINQRFGVPTEDETIWTIGIGSSSSESYRNDIFTAVNLSTPCIQTTTQTLDVFYRVQVLYDPLWEEKNIAENSAILTPEEIYMLARGILGIDTTTMFSITGFNVNFATKINTRKLSKNNDVVLGYAQTVSGTNTNIDDPEIFKGTGNTIIPIGEGYGRLIGITSIKNDTSKYNFPLFASKVSQNQPKNYLQTLYGHSSSAIVPFYDSATSQTSLGNISLNDTDFIDDDFPSMLKIKITGSGGIGTGTYKLQKRNIFGFENNTYNNRTECMLSLNYYNAHNIDGFRIVNQAYEINTNNSVEKYKYATIIKKTKTEVIAGNYNEIAIIDLLTQTGKRFAADTTPAMPVTEVTQFCHNHVNGDSLVACRNTGLYIISADKTTVTTIDSTSTGLSGVVGCYGVGVHNSGRIYAFFGGTNAGMYYSNDNGSTWTNKAFSFPVIDADPTLVKHIIVDKSHADGRIAVCYSSTLSSTIEEIYIAWWDFAANIAVNGNAVQGQLAIAVPNYGTILSNYQTYSDRWIEFTKPVTYFNHLDCSPNSSFWFTAAHRTVYSISDTPCAKFDFGTTTTSTIAGTDNTSSVPWQLGWGVDEFGNDAAFYITSTGRQDGKTNDSYGRVTMMVRSDLTYSSAINKESFNYEINFIPVLYLGEGIMLGYHENGSHGTSARDINSMLIRSICPNTENVGVFQNEMYPEYGWDGLNWVKMFNGDKTIHSSLDTTLKGVKIAFNDNGGADPFVATDYYTVTLYDGIQMDGSTTFEQEMSVYGKNMVRNTDFEISTIPNTQRVPNVLKEVDYTSVVQWQDVVGLVDSSPYLRNGTSSQVDTYTNGGRSLAPVIKGTTTDLATYTYYPGKKIPNIQGYVSFDWYSSGITNSIYSKKYVIGISGNSVLGTAINKDTIEFGYLFDDTVIDGDNIEVSVIESGVIKATQVIFMKSSYAKTFRIIILIDGSIRYEYLTELVGWVTLYASPPSTATIKDYYLDMALSGYSGNITDNILGYTYLPADNYFYFGDGLNTGIFDPDFQFIEPEYSEILIGGVSGINIGNDDDATVLNPNEYSIFRKEGVIRLSSNDVGKTISVEYLYGKD